MYVRQFSRPEQLSFCYGSNSMHLCIACIYAYVLLSEAKKLLEPVVNTNKKKRGLDFWMILYISCLCVHVFALALTHH
jgi:hypothetical protein